jgi:hypothetical protein
MFKYYEESNYNQRVFNKNDSNKTYVEKTYLTNMQNGLPISKTAT